MRHKTQLNIDIDIDIARSKRILQSHTASTAQNTSMPAKHAILAVALCATGAALVAPRLRTHTTKLAARAACSTSSPTSTARRPPPSRRQRPPPRSRRRPSSSPKPYSSRARPPRRSSSCRACPCPRSDRHRPFAAAAARQAWVKYKITSRRISVQSGVGGQDFTEIVYSDMAGMKFVYSGSKDAGDLVISLRDGAKLETRFVPQFQRSAHVWKVARRRQVMPDGRWPNTSKWRC